MTMDCAMDAQSMKSFLMENVFVETIMWETAPLEAAFLHAQPVSSNIKEDVLNAH